MNAPNLSRLLALEAVSRVADGAGGFVEVWQALGAVWAELAPGSGRDVPGEEVTLASVPYRITVRAAPYGTPQRPVAGQRFRDGPRVFSVLAVTERGPEARFLTCFAREEVLA
ncbi:MAG: head-tail adaptor protein [Pseudomonadota bacterium]